MKTMNQSTLILEDREFAILLQAKGIYNFQGIPLKNIPDTEEEVLQVLLSLTEKGFLISDGDDFVADREIAECFAVLEKARGVIVIIPKKETVSQSFCYPGECVIICQQAGTRVDTIKIRKAEWKELTELLQESGSEIRIQYYKFYENTPEREILVQCQRDACILAEGGDKCTWEELEDMLKKMTEDVRL